MIRLATLFMVLAAAPALADTLFAARSLRPGDIIMAEDLVAKPVDIAGMAVDPARVIGQEARIAIYAGRPIRLANIGPPALVERNQLVMLQYARAGLSIVVEGRALGRGGVGDRIRVMNSASRSTITGIVAADGSVYVY